MKKNRKQISVSRLPVAGLFLALFLSAGFVSHGQVVGAADEAQYQKRLEVLRSGRPYAGNPKLAANFKYRQDDAQARRIREYFRLDTLVRPGATTWENAKALAGFVARNIPHANQRIQPKERNAIALWQYHLEVENGFNCRLHSIMLHELLLASGITSRFVTCLPADSTDPDCHVVNVVWLPEMGKWAMIDSDNDRYITNSTGVPLSLEEMRQYVVKGKPMEIRTIVDAESADDYGSHYYRSYWAKNLYWFACWEEAGYNIEPRNEGRYICLVPRGFKPFKLMYYKSNLCTSDASRFWAAPRD